MHRELLRKMRWQLIIGVLVCCRGNLVMILWLMLLLELLLELLTLLMLLLLLLRWWLLWLLLMEHMRLH